MRSKCSASAQASSSASPHSTRSIDWGYAMVSCRRSGTVAWAWERRSGQSYVPGTLSDVQIRELKLQQAHHNAAKMPKCDYCDVYLTHDSMSVRKAHNTGRNHLRNVVDYYQQIGHEKAQSVIDSITSSYAAEGQSASNPMLAHPPGGPSFGGAPPPFGRGMPPTLPNGMPVPFPPPGGLPFPPPGGPGALPFPPPGGFPAGMPFPPPGGPGGLPFPPPPGGFPAGMPPLPPNFQFPAGGIPPPGGFPGFPPPQQGGGFPPPQGGGSQGPPDHQRGGDQRDARLQGRDAFSDRR
ncbi:hypothetical protein V500_03807 [Pseudogymnoascus sp. VKM F-4518 (FW-2643)]|nr:hypothetical protein V500_03807 [Pseudogymnoascus sp. VKM F-4518 (FW-2643)]